MLCDPCMPASQRFAVTQKQGRRLLWCSRVRFMKMQGLVFGQRSAVSPLQGCTGDCWASQSRQVCRLSHAAAVPCCERACKLGAKGNRLSTSMLWVCKACSMTQHILFLCWDLCCVEDAISTISMPRFQAAATAKVPRSCFSMHQPMWLVLCEDINSGDVTRHPQLLAAKQRKGFPNMAKRPGWSAWRGVSSAHDASCFSPFRVKDLSCGEFCWADYRFNNEFSWSIAAGFNLTRLCSGFVSGVGSLYCSKWIRTVPLRL